MSRISPASPPFPSSVQAQLDRLMPPGVEPLWLFRVLARDERLFGRLMGAGLLDRGHLTVREREIVILRVCANNRSEYEWGVHVFSFGAKARFTPEQVAATLEPSAAAGFDAGFDAKEQLLLRLCDELAVGTQVSDGLWAELAAVYSEEALLELLLLNGFYRTISILTNTLQMPLETYAARFPSRVED
ncbi:MAG: carboxymuconolactone decarboxylase family protein [Polyangiales bacterium]